MTKANEYIVKRINEDVFELWYDDRCLVTLNKEEAWPVMMGQVQPDVVVNAQDEGRTATRKESNDK